MLDDLFEQFSNPAPGHFIVEGRWCVEALLDSGEFETIAVIRAENAQQDFDEKYLHLTDLHILPKDRLSQLMGFAFHRGILALAKRPAPRSPETPNGLLVACPELADESNLGAIIRTAAALGAGGILVLHHRGADAYSRKSIRASSGAVFRTPIYECEDLLGDISKLKGAGCKVIGTSRDEKSIPLPNAPEFGDAIVLFGPENGGLSENWLQLCDVTVEIPMANGMDSLNVAACAAIVLYQLTSGSRT